YSPAPAERARLLLAQGEVGAAADWVAERGLREEDTPDYPREREYLVLARLLLARADPQRALPLLLRIHARATDQGRLGGLVEVRALQALALEAGGDAGRALEALVEALALARPEGYVQVFADEGAPMAALLRRLVASAQRGNNAAADGGLRDYGTRLLG